MMRGQQHDQQSRMICELSTLVFNLLQSPTTPLSFSDRAPVVPVPPSESPLRRSSVSASQITPAGFASLLLGISVALMLCGSVTFFIGFMLMPWVLILVMVFYVAGVLSSLSVLGRSILCFAAPRKDFPGGSFKLIEKGSCGLTFSNVIFHLTSGFLELYQGFSGKNHWVETFMKR